MPLPIITDDAIQYFTKILLADNGHFDAERIRFIKECGTVDVQACPGSGKTTCLLAKLLILAKGFPFENNQGILILSHTNAAVDEIKERILKHCPHLFEYPNFVGTIQGFVDQFLAIPFYQQRYGCLPYRIDDEIFNEKIWEPGPAKAWLNNNFNNQSAREDFLRNLRFDIDGNLVTGPDGKADKFRLKGKDRDTYKALLGMRQELLKNGYLCFDDAYYLAACYIRVFPKIVNLIQKRFAFVFIDEMQDTDTHQMGLLDSIFPSDGESIIQRIGDQNQAIYGRKVKSENAWVPRTGFLTLNGSKRLSESIASTIKNISLNPQDLTGNSQRKNIKPKIIVFGDATIKDVAKKFADLIIAHGLHQNRNAVFKAVGWRKTATESTGLTIGSYFDNYQILTYKSKVDFSTLNDYLLCNGKMTDVHGLMLPRKNILNGIIKALRIVGIKTANDAHFTTQSLLVFLKESHPNEYDALKARLYKWSCSIYKNAGVHDEIKIYISGLLTSIFHCNDSLIRSIDSFFVVSDGSSQNNRAAVQTSDNVFRYKSQGVDINVEIATIHSIKGETHAATLYLETYYYNDGGKSYESQRLIEQLKGNRVNNCGVRVKESLKMAYVGMSRPTELLCFAVHKSRIPDDETVHLNNSWDIISLA